MTCNVQRSLVIERCYKLHPNIDFKARMVACGMLKSSLTSLAPVETLSDSECARRSQLFRRDAEIMPWPVVM